MFKKTTILILSIISCASFAKEPKNIEFAKEQLIKYYESGEFAKDQTKIIDKAMLFLKNRIAAENKKHSGKNLAVVLDIDETSLSNYHDMKELNFGGTDLEIDEREGKGTDSAIKPTLELYRYAKANNIAVFFVTGRHEKYREGTVKNLEDVGFKNWDGLFLKPNDYSEKSASPYKISTRKQIEDKGYIIALNIGDQESDLVGKHAEKTFKLPNPYYHVP